MELYTEVCVLLAVAAGAAYWAFKLGKDQAKTELQERQKNIDLTYKNAMECEERAKQQIKALQKERDYSEELMRTRVERYRDMLEKAVAEESQAYPWLAAQVADIIRISDVETSVELRKKNRPALKAAEEVASIAREKRALQKENRMLQYQINYYETLFPWLEDFKELPPKEGWEYAHTASAEKSEYEILRNWLSPEEYQGLSTVEKYQLALDRYNSRKKTDWEVGIEYERYIGYLAENKGWKVRYIGAQYGLEDMGRDLLIETPDHIYVVQCKRWSKSKVIHEKHIFQLFGTTMLLRIKDPSNDYIGVFVTTTTLSDLARKCADQLKIQIIENYEMKPYPMIKCNCSNLGKIYHLPMDQQYDRVQISKKQGAMFAWTIQEAEENGFRRAYRWHPNKPQ